MAITTVVQPVLSSFNEKNTSFSAILIGSSGVLPEEGENGLPVGGVLVHQVGRQAARAILDSRVSSYLHQALNMEFMLNEEIHSYFQLLNNF